MSRSSHSHSSPAASEKASSKTTSGPHRPGEASAFQEQLDAWRGQVDKLRGIAYSANARLQAEMNDILVQLDERLLTANETLLAYLEAGEEIVESTRGRLETSWTELRSALAEALSKFAVNGDDDKTERKESQTRH